MDDHKAHRPEPRVRNYEVTSAGRVVVDLRELFQSEDVREMYEEAEKVAGRQCVAGP